MSSLVTFSDFKWVLWLSLLEPSVQPPTKMTVWQFAALSWDRLRPSGLRCFCISLKPSLSTPVLVLGLPHCRCLLHPKFKWEVLWVFTKIYYLLVACAREKEVDGVSFFQQLPCIIPFGLGLIFKWLKSSELGTPCWVAEPSSHRVAGIAGKGMSPHFGGRRMFQSEFALLHSWISVWCECVWMKTLALAIQPHQISRPKKTKFVLPKGLTKWPFRILADSGSRSLGVALTSSLSPRLPSPDHEETANCGSCLLTMLLET